MTIECEALDDVTGRCVAGARFVTLFARDSLSLSDDSLDAALEVLERACVQRGDLVESQLNSENSLQCIAPVFRSLNFVILLLGCR